jgi:hypothetical protein
MKKRNYSSLRLLIGLNYVGAVVSGIAILLLLSADYSSEVQGPLMFLCGVIVLGCMVQAQLISLMLNMAKDVEEITAAQTDNMTAMRKHLETQTNLLSVIAQHYGIDKGLLNEVVGDVGLQIPAEEANNNQQGTQNSAMDKMWEAGK